MNRLRAVARRYPTVADALWAAVLCGFLARVTADLGGTSGREWVWFGVLFVPLVWRRRRPVIVYWVVVALGFAAVTLGAMGPAPLIVPIVAVYSLARYAPARHLWPAMGVVVPFAVGWLWHGGPLWDVVTLTAVFAASVLLGTNLQTRRAYLTQLQERIRNLERVRIARDVHDIVAHNVAVMVALADGAIATNSADPQRATDMMDKVSATGREALTEIRRLVAVLREGGRDGQPGFDDVEGLIQRMRGAGMKVDFTRLGVPGPWGPDAGLVVYRIVQEALTNTMKHAGPHAKAQVRLSYHSGGAEVEVLDDGSTGEPAAGRGTGHGLAGMRERVASLGGHLVAGPRQGHRGWRVHARLPLSEGGAA